MKGFNKSMLPGNAPGNDLIETEQRNGVPIAVVLKKPPKLLEFLPTTPPTRAEESKETDASNFPILRGFA